MVGTVGLIEDCGVFGIGLNLLGDAYYGIACIFHRVPVACAYARKDCGAIGCALFDPEDFDRVSVDIGLDLAP